MRKLLFAGMLLGLVLPVTAYAQSPLDGTWKIDLSKAQLPKKPDVFVLSDGIYQCRSCKPPYRVKADGADHAVTGHPYYDTVAISVINDNTIKETDKKAGKVVSSSTTTVAPDGNSLTFDFTDSSNTNGEPVTGSGTATRVAKGPPNSSPISGSWHTTSFKSISDNGLTFTYKVEGDTLTMTSPTGQSYTAKMDGTVAPFKGDPGVTTVSVKKRGDNGIIESDSRNGVVIGISTNTVAADGRSMTIAVEDKLHGTTMLLVAEKQ